MRPIHRDYGNCVSSSSSSARRRRRRRRCCMGPHWAWSRRSLAAVVSCRRCGSPVHCVPVATADQRRSSSTDKRPAVHSQTRYDCVETSHRAAVNLHYNSLLHHCCRYRWVNINNYQLFDNPPDSWINYLRSV